MVIVPCAVIADGSLRLLLIAAVWVAFEG